jgi:hypothetical protein
MHHFYTLLALDLANERTREAQARYEHNQLVADSTGSTGARRSLTDAVRGVLSMFDRGAPTERRMQPRLPAGHTH